MRSEKAERERARRSLVHAQAATFERSLGSAAPASSAAVAISVRLCGLSTYEATPSTTKTSGAATSEAPSPDAAWETAALVRSKQIPAYAHSLSTGRPG